MLDPRKYDKEGRLKDPPASWEYGIFGVCFVQIVLGCCLLLLQLLMKPLTQ